MRAYVFSYCVCFTWQVLHLWLINTSIADHPLRLIDGITKNYKRYSTCQLLIYGAFLISVVFIYCVLRHCPPFVYDTWIAAIITWFLDFIVMMCALPLSCEMSTMWIFEFVWTRARRHIKFTCIRVPHRMIHCVCIDADRSRCVEKKLMNSKKAMRQTDIFGSAAIGRLGDGSFAKKRIQCELIGETRYITLALFVRARIIYKFQKFVRIFSPLLLLLSFVKSSCFF